MGHAAEVTNIAFASNDDYIISTGGDDSRSANFDCFQINDSVIYSFLFFLFSPFFKIK